jgi:peptidoglycan/xylan/chitin deacetylase (PgdA/CDA1 family)
MRLVSPLLKSVVYPAFASTGVLRRVSGAGLAVVTYHGILPPGYRSVDAVFDGNLISAEMFRRQLRLLKAKYAVISPGNMLAWCEKRSELPARAVLLTCDDGLLNNLTTMLPVLQEEKLSCLFFVTGGSTEEDRSMLWYEELFLMFLQAPAGRFDISSNEINICGDLGVREQRRALWWNAVKRLSQVDAEGRKAFIGAARIRFRLEDSWQPVPAGLAFSQRFHLLNRTELQQVASAGMTIGAHTMSHPMLSKAPAELAWAEIMESRGRLQSVVGKAVWAFAYPFGDAQSVTPKVIAMTKDAGYQAAFLNFGGGLGAELPLHALPRIHVTAAMNLSEFEAHVAGLHGWLQRRAG